MGDHPNAARFRSTFDSFNAGDSEAFGSMLAEDVVWHTIGGETMHGRDAVASSMSGMEGVEFETSLHDIVGNDEHVIGLVEAHVKVGDDELSYRTAEIMHVEDGLVTERWAFSDDTQAIIDFFGKFDT
jgi:ketosteroid isomerase-like protein